MCSVSTMLAVAHVLYQNLTTYTTTVQATDSMLARKPLD